jgi:hypothetical protein
MNKHIWKIMLLVSPLVLLVGCNDDEDIKPAPSLSVSGAPVSALAGRCH